MIEVAAVQAEGRRRYGELRTVYAEHPKDAATVKWARTFSEGDAARDPYHTAVEIGAGFNVSVGVGVDRKIGGPHDRLNPGDLMCSAVAACLDVSIRMAANLLGVELERLSVEVTGDWDARGALMFDASVPVGFGHLACTVDLEPADPTEQDKVKRLLAIAEQTCVNAATIRNSTPITVQVREPLTTL